VASGGGGGIPTTPFSGWAASGGGELRGRGLGGLRGEEDFGLGRQVIDEEKPPTEGRKRIKGRDVNTMKSKKRGGEKPEG